MPVKWILLDSASTVNIFSNLYLFKNNRHVNGRYINIHRNAGVRRVTNGANLKGYGTVWFNKGAISNILYLHKAKQRFTIQYDWNEYVLSIQNPERVLYFHPSVPGLYYYDTTNHAVVTENTIG